MTEDLCQLDCGVVATIKKSSEKIRFHQQNDGVVEVFTVIRNPTARIVLDYLIYAMSSSWNLVRLTPQDRKSLCRYAKIDKSTLSRALTCLEENDLIKGRNKIMINPKWFWKKDFRQRNRILSMYEHYDEKIDYDTGSVQSGDEKNNRYELLSNIAYDKDV